MVSCAMFSQDCGAMWLKLWHKCRDPSAFLVSVTLAPEATDDTVAQTAFNVTTHEAICDPFMTSNTHSDKCARAVIGVTGSLLVKMMMFGAFVTPALFMLSNHPVSTKIIEWVVTLIKHDYRRSKKLDLEMVSTMMPIALGVLWGVSMPILYPLIGIKLWLHRALFYHVVHEWKMPVKYKARPSQSALALLMWLFMGISIALIAVLFSTNDLHGQWEVFIGMPLSVVATVLIVSRHNAAAAAASLDLEVAMRTLEAPLLDRELQ